MESKKPTQTTRYMVQHGYCIRKAQRPNHDAFKSYVVDEPNEWFIDGYADTFGGAITICKDMRKTAFPGDDSYDVLFEILCGSNWNDEIGDFEDWESMETIDFWMKSISERRDEAIGIIDSLILRTIDMDGSCKASWVLLRALQKRMEDTDPDAMLDRYYIQAFVEDRSNWNDDYYDPSQAMGILDSARKRAIGGASAFREED